MKVVIDASALIDLILSDALPEGLELEAPTLLDYELLSGVRKQVRLGLLSELDALDALGTIPRLRIGRHDAPPLLLRAWTLRHNLTAYDASYVALAELLGAPLVTADARLAKAASPYCDVIAA